MLAETSHQWTEHERVLRRARYNRYRAKNLEQFSAYDAAQYRKRCVGRLLSQAKIRAARKGLPFDIEAGDLTVPEVCPALGIPIVIGRPVVGQHGFGSPNSPSLDRIIPALGYVKGNVQIISWRANTLKNDATPEELRMLADFISKTQES